jgi:hypothetical protein
VPSHFHTLSKHIAGDNEGVQQQHDVTLQVARLLLLQAPAPSDVVQAKCVNLCWDYVVKKSAVSKDSASIFAFVRLIHCMCCHFTLRMHAFYRVKSLMREGSAPMVTADLSSLQVLSRASTT